MDPVGMLCAGYRSGPSNIGLTVPIGSAVPFQANSPIFLTASHILVHVQPELPDVNTEIKPKFVNLLIGIHCDTRWEFFLVKEKQEILPEVTALYLEHKSTDGNSFPDSLSFSISQEEPQPMLPVHMLGYPASVQSVGLEPDPDFMEVTSQSASAYSNVISGTVSAYYRDHCPHYISKVLLPAFTIDAAVIPGMSGGGVMMNLPKNRQIVGMVIKNLKIVENDYHIVHSVAVALHDIDL